jgi:CHASE3 domain sensor protein
MHMISKLQGVLAFFVAALVIIAVVRSWRANHTNEALRMIRRKREVLARKQQKLSDLEAEIVAKRKT